MAARKQTSKRARKGRSAPGAEQLRLEEDARREANWKRWGPYLSERQWGTVREDYSHDSESWDDFSFEQSASRAYRWGEDGLLGFTDRQCRLCLAPALWNGKDPILKERLYGLTGPQGNHGEDVKELYYYLDSTPTHSWARALYKYPQEAYPYERLVAENAARGLNDAEFELEDTGVFDRARYFDVYASFAKGGPNDLLVEYEVINRGGAAAELHFLPQLWFRNTWIWGCEHEGCTMKPRITFEKKGRLSTEHETLGQFALLYGEASDGTAPTPLFTENESNSEQLWGSETYTPYVKDAFHRHLIHGEACTNTTPTGTKAGLWYRTELAAGQRWSVRLRLFCPEEVGKVSLGKDFEKTFEARRAEADAFYAAIQPKGLAPEQALVQRQAYAGMLWSKQFYHYSVKDWLKGDPEMPPPPEERWQGRNGDWLHLFNRDVLSMPDKWEYPWFAAWDSAFHMIPFARLDGQFAKDQLLLFLREWYMHPNGQIPAYEYNFSDVNPPVHAWACWRVYKMTGPRGERDLAFLKRAFNKLLINFTWWVNRKDPQGNNLFAGGFLGLDNIGVFDRSKPLPGGGELAQADGTAWMAFYCSTMLSMALELAWHDHAYEDVASKFFEHFVGIAEAMNSFGGTGLWDEQDGFYYDQLQVRGQAIPLKIRSMVGLIPLFAVQIIPSQWLEELPGFRKRMNWFLEHRRELGKRVIFNECEDTGKGLHLLAIPTQEQLERVLSYLLDESEFLSPYGVRSLSRHHEAEPFHFECEGAGGTVGYTPGESDSWLFGGNSNWRGPIWFPVNYLLIEALQAYHHFYGDTLQVECPKGSGNFLNLEEVADELSRRLIRLFERNESGKLPASGTHAFHDEDPHSQDLRLFYEYFHPETGRGCGASHQTGWTGLVAKLIQDLGRR